MSDNTSPILSFKTYGVLIALVILFSVLTPLFLTWDNLLNILLATTVIGLLAMTASFVIGSAGLDLSVGSIVALSGCIAASVATTLSLPWFFIIIICLLAGAVIGGMNGFLIGYIKIPAFIATLGMLSIARGATFIFTDGRPIYGLPEPITYLGQGALLSIPVPIWILLCSAITLHILLKHTVFGIHTLAIGDNEKAAKNVGINISWHKLKLYALSGFFAALAGLIFMGRVNAADPNAGLTYEITAITGALLGGTNLFGGRASVIGAIVGALIMGVLQNGLTLLAIPTYYQLVAIGLVLITAVWMDKGLKR